MKYRQMPPNRKARTYKPPAVRTRIIVKKIAGKSNRQIAREEGIDRETVGRILSDPEYRQILNVHRQEILALVPKAIAAYHAALDARKVTPERVRAASDVLHGTQVFVRKEQHDMTDDRFPYAKLTRGELIEEAKNIFGRTGIEIVDRDRNSKA